MSSWHAPQKIYSLAHREGKLLLGRPVQVQEKVDGSFFAFGAYPDETTGELELKIRSKGAVMIPDAPMKMFARAVETIKGLFTEGVLKVGWQYRGEMLDKPKHNALAYDRVPYGNLILFDILTDEETYLSYGELSTEAVILGLEVVPQLKVGVIEKAEDIRDLLNTVSCLGGQKIEGVVIKPLEPLYGADGKLIMTKFVSEAFKEVHSKTWGESNPTSADIITRLGTEYGTQARWQKSLIHLREAGLITDSPKDIGSLLHEVVKDVGMECKEDIQKALWKWAWPHIQRGLTRGLPAWYKDLLLSDAFETPIHVDIIPENPSFPVSGEIPQKGEFTPNYGGLPNLSDDSI